MKKCSKCQQLFAQKELTHCPNCGNPLEILLENPAPAELPRKPDIVNTQPILLAQASFSYNRWALVLLGISLGLTFFLSWWTIVFIVLFWLPSLLLFTSSLRNYRELKQTGNMSVEQNQIRAYLAFVFVLLVLTLILFIYQISQGAL